MDNEIGWGGPCPCSERSFEEACVLKNNLDIDESVEIIYAGFEQTLTLLHEIFATR